MAHSLPFYLTEVITDFFYPKWCIGCGIYGTYLCTACTSKIKFFASPLCPGCMEPIKAFTVHAKCKARTNLDGLYATTSFRGNVQQLLADIKYNGYFAMSPVAAKLLATHCAQLVTDPPLLNTKRLLVPIPLHAHKHAQRGFNQSQKIAKWLGVFLHIPTASKILVKVKKTDSQMGLSRKQRLGNQTGAFACPYRLNDNPTIFLIDDVVTTGSTMSECAHVLKKAGAKKVYGLAVAHGK